MSVTTRSKSKSARVQLLMSAGEKEKSSDKRKGRKRKHDDRRDEVNPFLVELVLQNLFKFVQLKDLLACRSVCLKWNLLSLPFVRSKLCIEIVGARSPLQHKRGIANFMEMVRTNTFGNPFEKFSLGSFDTTTEAGQQFIQLCGPTTRYISFRGDGSFIHVIQDVSNFLQSTPNLVSFKMPEDMSSKNGTIKLFDNTNPKPKFKFLQFLDVRSESPNLRRKICPTFYEELFEAAPNILTLWLNGNSSLEVLETIKKLGREKSIENLGIQNVTEKHLDLFRSTSTEWNLKQLELTDCTQEDTYEFRGFELVKIVKNTLIALRLNCNRGIRSTHNLTVIPFLHRMPKLRLLQLRLNWEMSLQFGSFNDIFPALEKIDIDFDFGNYCRKDPSNVNILVGDEPCSIPTLKSSIIRCSPITLERLERIITIFPTLKILKCEVTGVNGGAKIFKSIWSRMTQLEGLHIYGRLTSKVNIDQLITGLPAKEIKSEKMECFFKTLEVLEIDGRRDRISVETSRLFCRKTLPSIRNLTNLRSLKINLFGEAPGSMNHTYLTDVTGYFALYSLKNLQHLDISVSELSKSCAQILVKDKNLMTWKFKCSAHEDIIPGSWQHKISDNRDQDNFPLLKV